MQKSDRCTDAASGCFFIVERLKEVEQPLGSKENQRYANHCGNGNEHRKRIHDCNDDQYSYGDDLPLSALFHAILLFDITLSVSDGQVNMHGEYPVIFNPRSPVVEDGIGVAARPLIIPLGTKTLTNKGVTY
jgi:hypothetical protein